MTNRLLETGILQKLLREKCQEKEYILCPYQHQLTTERGLFLWIPERSPLYSIGGWNASESALSAMIVDSIYYYPLDHVKELFLDTFKQLAVFDIANFSFTFSSGSVVSNAMNSSFAADTRQYWQSRQQGGGLNSKGMAIFHSMITWLSLALMFVYLIQMRGEVAIKLYSFVSFTWLFILANAAVCVYFSHIESRYQARVVWLIPLALLIAEFSTCLKSMRGVRKEGAF